MPQRIAELQKISTELMLLAQRANDIGDMQLAKLIVDAVTLSNADRAKTAAELLEGARASVETIARQSP